MIRLDEKPLAIKAPEAKKILKKVFSAVSNWHKIARKIHLSSGTIDSYASAFENLFMDEAKNIIAS